MANIKSQIKRIRTTKRETERNKAVRTELKTYVKKARVAIAEGKGDEVTAVVRAAGRKLDKAASAGIIHKRNAANRKSGLIKLLAKGPDESAAAGKKTKARAKRTTAKRTTKKTTSKAAAKK